MFEAAAVNHRIPSPVLPEELINEILLRLPVKHLLQFKCVCKSWKTLISDPQFAKNHLRIPSLTNQKLVFFVAKEPNKMVSYPLKQLLENSSIPVKPDSVRYMKIHKYCIIGSCNGLLCLYYKCQRRVRLYNPSIRFQSKKSPQAVSHDWRIKQFGFGYDHVNDKYKLLVIAQNRDDLSQSLTKIYTFGENLWKTIPNFSLTPINSLHWLGKFVSGTLNWIVCGFSSNQNSILSFNVEKETHEEMLLPQNDDVNVHTRKPYVLGNYLCVFDIYFTIKHQCDVWLMKEFGVAESWTKQILITSENQTSFVEPFFILDNGGALLLANKLSSQIILYNLNNAGLDYPLITGTTGFKPHTTLHIHRESLVSPQW
ncbi:unnamed protein product [Lathyrus sativus]|nr:unnamed protein product [Lathyrus sativus]